jgi:energy-coupling factor transport system permease protein
VTVGYNPAVLNPSVYPLHWPSLPLIPAAAILAAALAAVVAPSPPVLVAADRPVPDPQPVVPSLAGVP